jgi:hypothetical protein
MLTIVSVIDTSVYGLLTNADTASKSRSYRKMEGILNALYKAGADHGEILFKRNNLCRSVNAVPSSPMSLPPAERAVGNESNIGNTKNQNRSQKPFTAIANDASGVVNVEEGTGKNLLPSSPDNSHTKKDRSDNFVFSTSNNNELNDTAVDFLSSLYDSFAQDISSGGGGGSSSSSNGSLSGASLAPRTNTSTLRPVSAMRYYHQPLPPSVHTSRNDISPGRRQDSRKPLHDADLMPPPAAGSSMASFSLPISHPKAKPMVQKLTDRYVPPKQSNTRKKRKMKQQDHDYIHPKKTASFSSDYPQSLSMPHKPLSLPQFKGVEIVTHQEEEAIVNPTPSKKIRGMPVKQPKVISVTTTTQYFVKLPVMPFTWAQLMTQLSSTHLQIIVRLAARQ